MSKQFLRKAMGAARYGVSIRTFERMVIDKRVPPPHYRGRMPLWDEDELDASDRAAVLASRPKAEAATTRTAKLA